MNLLARLLRIRKGEGRVAVLVVGLMLVSMAAITIGESGIDALFFDRVGSRALPVMYLLQGSVTFMAMLGLSGALGRLGPRRGYLAAPVALGVLVLAERALIAADVAGIYQAMWITVGLGTLVQGVFLWGTAGAVVDTRQAKRLFPIFAAGGILGAVLGGLLTRPLASLLGAQNLLFVWAAGLGGAFVLARLVLGAPASRGRRPARRRRSALGDMTQGFAFVRRSRLLVWMTVAAVLFSVLFYSLYLPYARAASERYPDPDELAAFFGLFWAAVTGAAFLVSVLVTNRLFAWLGVAAMVLLLPVMYLGAFGILLVRSGFATLVLIRFVMGVWLQGVASPGWETLTNVVPESRRDQTRAFLNGGPTQIGTVIAGVIALVGQDVLTLQQFAVIGLVAAALTTLAAVRMRRSYAGALVDALRAARPQVFGRSAAVGAPIVPVIDAEAAQVLSGSIGSPDVHVRRLAYQLLADVPPEARPEQIATGLQDEDTIVRLAATRSVDIATAEMQDAVLALIGDHDPAVAAAAAARLLGATDDSRPERRLCHLLADPDDRARRIALDQLELAPPERAAPLAAGLLTDASGAVRAAALERLAAVDPRGVADRAAAAIRDPDPAVRIAAGRALGLADGHHMPLILEALGDPRCSDAAVEAIRCFEPNGDGELVREFVGSSAARAARDRRLAAAVPPGDDVAELLREALLERGRRVARSALWAAAALAPRRDEMQTAIENLNGVSQVSATALETIEAAGEKALVRPLLAMWEPLAAPKRDDAWLPLARHDDDLFIRRCAELARARLEGGPVPDTVEAFSLVERVLYLRKVSLFAELPVADLERVAEIAQEHGYADGEVIAAEGELGDELHIVIDGSIRVVQDRDGSEVHLARRSAGEVVGELSIITEEPRVASLVAEGAVRTVGLDRRDFESMLRERPDIALAVMRMLAGRLAQEARRSDVAR